jgi:hypothetical protein
MNFNTGINTSLPNAREAGWTVRVNAGRIEYEAHIIKIHRTIESRAKACGHLYLHTDRLRDPRCFRGSAVGIRVSEWKLRWA